MREVCKFPDCNKPHRSKGYCAGHYTQLKRNNYDLSKLTFLKYRIPQNEVPEFCSFPGCDREHGSSGYCHAHYEQLRNFNGNVSKMTPISIKIPQDETPEFCMYINPNTDEKCDKSHYGKGYCHSHYMQLHRSNWDKSKLAPIGIRIKLAQEKTCNFIDSETNERCDKSYSSLGYCRGHYSQLKKNNYDKSRLTPLWDKSNRDDYYNKVLENYPELKTKEEIDRRHELLGIIHFHNPTYSSSNKRLAIVVIYNNKRRGMNFSRHLMELKLLRKLEIHEEVDHIDEDKLNDHINNLQILTREENLAKSHQNSSKDRYILRYSFICPVCGIKSITLNKYVKNNHKNNDVSGPTCSHKCGGILSDCKSLNEGKLITTKDDIISRFIKGKETEEDKDYIQPSEEDIGKLKKWRLYFKHKLNFNKFCRRFIINSDSEELRLQKHKLSFNIIKDKNFHSFNNLTYNWQYLEKVKFICQYININGGNDFGYELFRRLK